MKDRNDKIAIDKFKDNINDSIEFIIDIAFTAGKIAGMTEQIKAEDRPSCKGCVHFSVKDHPTCFDCVRLQRADLYYEGNYDIKDN